MILALDPGITTGVAKIGFLPVADLKSIALDQIQLSHEGLYDYIYAVHPTEIVCESFVYQRRNKVEL